MAVEVEEAEVVDAVEAAADLEVEALVDVEVDVEDSVVVAEEASVEDAEVEDSHPEAVEVSEAVVDNLRKDQTCFLFKPKSNLLQYITIHKVFDISFFMNFLVYTVIMCAAFSSNILVTFLCIIA